MRMNALLFSLVIVLTSLYGQAVFAEEEYTQPPTNTQTSAVCGDGVCSEIEFGLCPRDCGGPSQTTQEKKEEQAPEPVQQSRPVTDEGLPSECIQGGCDEEGYLINHTTVRNITQEQEIVERQPISPVFWIILGVIFILALVVVLALLLFSKGNEPIKSSQPLSDVPV